MILYHGSDKEVIIPKFSFGNPSNDYGLGFYLTPLKEIGELWASKYDEDGYLMSYEVNIEKLKVLKLNNAGIDNVMRWLTILVKNRFDKEARILNKDTIDWLIKHFDIDLNDYDVVVGYRADDSYFAYSREFVENRLSFEALSEAMKLGKLGEQFVLISKESFNNIRHIKTNKIRKDDSYNVFRNKVLNEYHEIKNKDSINNTFIRDIMRKYGS